MVGLREKQVSYQKCQIQFHTIFCPCLLEIINSTIALRQKKRFCTQGFCPMSFLSLILTAFVILRSRVDQVLPFSIVLWSKLEVKNLKCTHFECIYWNRLATETVDYIWYWCKRNIPCFSFFVQFLLHIFDKHAYLLRFWSDSHNRLWNFNVLKIHLPISLSKQIVISNIEQFYFFTYPYVTKYFFVFIVTPNISINGVQCIVHSTIL